MAKKSRKVFATTATAALVASAVAPIASSAAGFSDVTKPEYKEAINALADAGILNGYENGTFKPENKVTRGEVAKVITLIRHLEDGTKTPFKDVKDGYWSTQYINSLYAAKLVNGYEDGTFKPEGNVTRAEFAKLVVDAYGLTLTNSATPFTDVKAGNWATPYIQTAYANGLIKGVTASKFDPSAPIKRGDLAILLHRADSKFGDVIGNNFPGVELVKATNNTTVEVTFKEEVSAKDVKASDFSIEGLTVSNAAVKQTDNKTVVLTTSTQEGGKQYTVKRGAATLGKFIGVSSVVPKSINLTTPSVQGTIGKEVTLKAEVTVEDGQSKAGIPVTFNIVSDKTDINNKIEAVAYTDEKGVASYSYTRYYKHNDNVTAYATDKSSVLSSGKVYWAESLSLTEVTEGNALANGSKKVYKIKTSTWMTETNDTTTTSDDYNYVNVAFKENVDVTPDKLVRDVKVIDTGLSGNDDYPSQVTTGGVNKVRVKVNASGEATFTLTGSNASVTPIVFVDADKDSKYDATELQASAPTVKFDINHTLGLVVKAEGEQNAAAINANGTGQGGRDYTITLTDKDGKVAPEGTEVKVVFPEGSFSTDRAVYFTSKAEGTKQIVKDTLYTVKVAKDGKATFTLTGNKDGFAQPTVFVNNGTDDAKLDKSDLQTVADKTFFVNAIIKNATLVAEVDGKEVTETSGSNTVDFIYTSVDQNGKKYVANPSNYEVSYEVKAQFGDVKANGTLVKKGTTETVKANAVNGVATLSVVSVDPTVASTVTVSASASQVSLPNKSVSINFTNSKDLPATHTGYVTNLDEVNEKITIDNYNPVSYAKGSYFNSANQEINKSEFVSTLKNVAAGKKAKVTVAKQADGSYKFNIISLTDSKTPEELFAEAKAKLDVKVAEVNAKVAADYTTASWTSFVAAKTTAAALPEATTANINDKIAAYDSALGLLVTKASDDAAQAAATKRLNDAKAAADSKEEADYTTASWTAFTGAKTTAAALPETTANQKIAKAIAYEDAVKTLVGKSSFASFTVAVDETNAATGELLFTFSETSTTPVTGFKLETLSAVNGATTGTVANVTPSATPDNAVKIKVQTDASTPAAVNLTQQANQGATYTFTATVEKADFFAKDVIVTVKYDTVAGKWVATAK